MSNQDRISEVYKGEIWAEDAQERARRRIHWMASQARGKRVLDIGCSQGITSILLGREGFDVIGVDVEGSRVEYAKADLALETNQTRERVTFLVGDGGELEFDDDSFDTVLLGEVVEHLVAPERVLKEATRVLRVGGVAVITTPFGFLHHHDHKQTFFPDNLSDLISQHLGIVSAEIGDRYFRVVGQKGTTTEAVVIDSLREQGYEVVGGIQEELLDARKRINTLSSNLDKVNESATQSQRRVAQLEKRLSRSEARHQETERQRDNVKDAWREAKAALADAERNYRSISAELKKASEQAKTAERLSEELRKVGRRLAKREREVVRLRHRLDVSDWKLASLRQRRWWRLGSELSEVRRRPRSLLTLPARLVRVVRSKPPRLPRPEPPGIERGSSSGPQVGPVTDSPSITPRHDVAALALVGPELRELLSHELLLFDVDIDSWQDQITSLAPQLLIADASSMRFPGERLIEVLESAKKAGIATVLWGEGSSSTPHMLRAQFDVIVGDSKHPTDSYAGRIVNRIGSVQPMIHNPIGAKRAQDTAAVDLDKLVLAEASYSTSSELALASKNFKVLQTSVQGESSDLAILAAMATPVITQRASNGFSLSAASEEEATVLERSLLKSEVLRARLTHPRMREAIRQFSIGSVVDRVLSEENQAWPLIDIMVATKRPEKLEFLFENLGRQTHPNFRIFLVAHGVTLDEEHTKSLADRAGLHLAAVIQVPETVILGEVFNIGFGETEADIVAKMDDDDIYGAEYLWDLYSALDFSGAEVAGKWAHYAYLQGPDTLVYRYRDYEHRFTDVVAISTLLMKREVLDVERFPEMPWGSGSVFLRALGAQGGRVFAADRWNYLYVRGQDGDRNTFPISDLRLLSISDVVCRGMNVEEAMV